jgi:hypothetical protein
MPRYLANLERETGQLEPLPVINEPVGGGARERKTERAAQVEIGVTERIGIIAADEQGHIGVGTFQCAVAGDVIDVPMRVEDDGWAKSGGFEQSKHCARIESWVDHDRILPPALPQDVTILTEGSRFDNLDCGAGNAH